jgi:hypothetical protein
VTTKKYRFRPARTLGMALVTLLALTIVLAAVSAAMRISEIDLLQRIGRGELVSAEEANRSDDRVAAVTIAGLIVLVITGIVWLVWQHRSQANLHAARLRELEYTPGWSVGWWLIPFANLVKPFQTMRELWKASGGDDSWWRNPTWSLIGWWWAVWIAGTVLDRVAAISLNRGEATVDGLISGSRLFLASEVVTIVAGILAILIVRSVIGRQEGLQIAPVGDEVPPPRPDVPDWPPASGL